MFIDPDSNERGFKQTLQRYCVKPIGADLGKVFWYILCQITLTGHPFGLNTLNQGPAMQLTTYMNIANTLTCVKSAVPASVFAPDHVPKVHLRFLGSSSNSSKSQMSTRNNLRCHLKLIQDG